MGTLEIINIGIFYIMTEVSNLDADLEIYFILF